MHRHVHDAAAASSLERRTTGKNWLDHIPVVSRIRIDRAGDRAVFGSDLRFDAARAP